MRARLVLRVRLLSIAMALFALLLCARLYQIQIVHGDDYARKAEGQYMEAVTDDAPRGEIFFRKKDGERVAAALMQKGWRAVMDPRALENPDEALSRLATIVSLDEARFRSSAAKKEDPYEEIAFRLNDEQALEIRRAEIPGIFTVRDEWRFYPGESLAAHTIGFVSYRGARKEGAYGLERYWEDVLRHEGSGLYVNPFAEIFSNLGALVAEPSEQEGSIITALEPSAQRELENAIAKVMEAHTPRQVGGIVMDPKSGEIVALAMAPSFDPNTFNLVEDVGIFSNPLVERRYEMGSIVKPLTIAAAIDAGAITPNTTYEDRGCITKTGYKLCNFDFRGRGVVPMQEVLSQSLNTGVSFAVDKMGNATFADYVKRFGLGEETGIDLPGEIPGAIDSLFVQGAADVDFASASFGQSIAITPIAMIRALATLANDGVLPEPHVATAIRTQTGIERRIGIADGTRVLKPETAETVTDMLVKVYDEALLEGVLKQEHHSIAAKTGTAQIAIPGGGGYYTDRWLHSFFGYFPAHEPRFIVLLFAIEPHGEQYASRTLAHPFSDLAKFLINYYEIPPDR